jgi:hypothetical protein
MNINRKKPLILKRESFVKNELKFIKYSDQILAINCIYNATHRILMNYDFQNYFIKRSNREDRI